VAQIRPLADKISYSSKATKLTASKYKRKGTCQNFIKSDHNLLSNSIGRLA